MKVIKSLLYVISPNFIKLLYVDEHWDSFIFYNKNVAFPFYSGSEFNDNEFRLNNWI